MQAQKASRAVSRGLRAGSATAKVGSRSTSGVSQLRRPASTRVASNELNDLVTEPIQQGVRRDRLRLPELADAKALQENHLAALDNGHRRPWHAGPASFAVT